MNLKLLLLCFVANKSYGSVASVSIIDPVVSGNMRVMNSYYQCLQTLLVTKHWNKKRVVVVNHKSSHNYVSYLQSTSDGDACFNTFEFCNTFGDCSIVCQGTQDIICAKIDYIFNLTQVLIALEASLNINPNNTDIVEIIGDINADAACSIHVLPDIDSTFGNALITTEESLLLYDKEDLGTIKQHCAEWEHHCQTINENSTLRASMNAQCLNERECEFEWTTLVYSDINNSICCADCESCVKTLSLVTHGYDTSIRYKND